MNAAGMLALHQNVAFQLSGGKDSLAALFLLRSFWPRMTVYWLSTGDNFPETKEVIEYVKGLVPNFVEVKSNAAEEWMKRGFPVDVLPVRNTMRGQRYEGRTLGMQSRYTCCERVIQMPMHKRMKEDGITLIIRGQKAEDLLKGPLRSGDIIDGVQFYYPVETWTDEKVLAFLEEMEVPVPRFYKTMKSTPDCMHCTAYLYEGKGPYMKRHHPEAYATLQSRLTIINDEIQNSLAPLLKELYHD